MTPLELSLKIEELIQLLFLDLRFSVVFWLVLPNILSLVDAVLPVSLLRIVTVVLGSISVYTALKRQSAPLKDWKSELVVITGASNGIGRLLAQKLISTGSRVVNIDRMPDVSESSQKPYFYYCDLTNREQILETVQRIVAELGNPTMLINNAGIVDIGLFADRNIETTEKVLSVNLNAHLVLIKQMLPIFLEQKRGHILSVSSIVGLCAPSGMLSYVASKFGVSGYMEALRNELYTTKINVSCIFPGIISTGMFQGVKHKIEWATPPLEPKVVADAMFNILESNRSQEVVLPIYGRLAPLFRMFPVEFGDLVKYYWSNDDYKTFEKSISQEVYEKLKQ